MAKKNDVFGPPTKKNTVDLAVDAALKVYNQQQHFLALVNLIKITKSEKSSSKVGEGYTYTINFLGSKIMGLLIDTMKCVAEVWEKLTHELVVQKVDCKSIYDKA